jgi:hypothetical protein
MQIPGAFFNKLNSFEVLGNFGMPGVNISKLFLYDHLICDGPSYLWDPSCYRRDLPPRRPGFLFINQRRIIGQTREQAIDYLRTYNLFEDRDFIFIPGGDWFNSRSLFHLRIGNDGRIYSIVLRIFGVGKIGW